LHDCCDRPGRLEVPTLSRGESADATTSDGEHEKGRVGLEVSDERAVGGEQTRYFVCHGREKLGRRNPAGDMRGNSA